MTTSNGRRGIDPREDTASCHGCGWLSSRLHGRRGIDPREDTARLSDSSGTTAIEVSQGYRSERGYCKNSDN